MTKDQRELVWAAQQAVDNLEEALNSLQQDYDLLLIEVEQLREQLLEMGMK